MRLYWIGTVCFINLKGAHEAIYLIQVQLDFHLPEVSKQLHISPYSIGAGGRTVDKYGLLSIYLK